MAAITHTEYLDRLYELAGENQQHRDPMRKAWICLESELHASCGRVRYSTYNSFKAGKSRKPHGVKMTIPKTG